MDKNSIKGNLWIIGVLLVVAGVFLIGFFLLNDNFYYFTGLIPYTIGFLLTGLIVSIFGFLFTIISLDAHKADNTIKIRIILIAVTIIYLVLMGYLASIDHEWTIKALIIEWFDPSFAFYSTFTISSYTVFFATLLVFGILVLPFVINELGILDSYSDEKSDDFDEEVQTFRNAEDSVDRFVTFLKKRSDPLKKIKNYTLPIAVTLIILGGSLVGLPYFLIKDGPLSYDTKTETWFIKDYKGFMRGQLLLIGILFLVIGFILINQIRCKSHSTDKEKQTI